jgi:pimeloyl-ACP methyl ester carboxylesterase
LAGFDTGKRAMKRTFRGAGLNINCIDYGGEGRPPLLFIHGGSAFGHWWDFVAPPFVDRFHALAMDLRGHGESDHSADGQYAIEDYAADVAAMIESWGLGDPALVGHSRGGLVAMAYAAAHRGRVRALAVIDSPAFISEEVLLAFAQSVKDWRPRRYATLEQACAGFKLLPRETHATPDMLRQMARFAYRQEDDGAWVVRIDPRCRAREPFNALDYLPNVACPTLIVKAELSPLLSREHARRMAAAVRGSGTMAEIKGAYHHAMLDNPGALVRILSEFLDPLR